MTMVVEQQGSNLRVNRMLKIQGEERKEIHTYKIGGGETTNTGSRGETVVGRAFWEGDKLVIVSTITRRGLLKDVSAESRGVWSLSPDAKSLTIARWSIAPVGSNGARWYSTSSRTDCGTRVRALEDEGRGEHFLALPRPLAAGN